MPINVTPDTKTETAYRERVSDKPTTTKVSDTPQSSYIPGSHTPLPNPTKQQTPSYQQASYYPTFSPVSFESSAQSSSLFFKNMTEKDITQYAQNLFANGANHPELTNYSQSASSVSSDQPIKDPLKDTPKETENKNKEKNKFITGIGTALDVMSLFPGVDNITNIISIPFDIYEGDYWGALLSAIGAFPLVGEFADTAKAARVGVGVEIADKVHDASKFAKFADKTLDILKNPKVLEEAGEIGKCLYNGMLTGRVYESDGKSYSTGFINGLSSSLVPYLMKKTNMKKEAATIIGESIGSSLSAIIEGVINGNNIEEIVKSSAESAAVGILTGAGAAYIDYTIDMAKEANSVAKTLMKFDENLGKGLELFFNSLITVLTTKEY